MSAPVVEPLAPAHRLTRAVYNALVAILLPALTLYYAWRVTLGGKRGRGFLERLGRLPASVREALKAKADAPRVWVHAVSVGEVAATEPILRELRRQIPEACILLSVTTMTGRQHAEERMRDCDALFYLPLDLPLCVGAALAEVRPDVLVLMETELWPNLLDRARALGIRTMVANGRISDRSFRRMRAVRPLYAWVLDRVEHLRVQTEEDASRARALGAEPERIAILGNSKFDESPPPMSPEAVRALREEFGIAESAPVIVYASTGPGEDVALLDAFQAMRLARPGLRLIHAPRKPERGEEVARLVRERGFDAVRRSKVRAGEESPLDRDAVIVLDTIGELTALFALADVAFIGRSLVPLGGGNLLQPLGYGKPVLIGPHATNFRQIVRVACEAGLCEVVGSGEELAEKALALLEDGERRERIARDAARLLAENRGASARYAEAIADLLLEAGPSGA